MTNREQDLRTALKGWKLVPVELPRCMKDAVAKQVDDFSREHVRLFVADIWADLLAATPAPPRPVDAERVELHEACVQVASTYEAKTDAIRKFHVAYDADVDVAGASRDSHEAQVKHGEAIQHLVRIARKVGTSPAHSPDKAVTREGVDISQVRQALQDADWSGVSIGNKWLIAAAIDALATKPTGTEAGRGVGAEKDADYDLVAEWLDWNAKRIGDVYLGDATSVHVLRAFIKEQIEMSLADAATPTPPVSPSPDSTGPAGAMGDLEKAIRDRLSDCSTVDWYEISRDGVNNLAMLAAQAVAALTPSAPIADPSPDSTGQGDAQTQEGGLLPMEDAPKDGTKIDIWCYWPEHDRVDRSADCHWVDEDWLCGHWSFHQYLQKPKPLGWRHVPAAPPAPADLSEGGRP